MPIVGAEWRNEHDYGLSGIIGFPGTRVQYRFNDLLAARVAAKWIRDYLSSVQRQQRRREGVRGRVRLYGRRVSRHHAPFADLKLTVGAELLFDRQLRLYDSGGDEFSKTDVDRARSVRSWPPVMFLGYKRIQHGGAVPEHSLRRLFPGLNFPLDMDGQKSRLRTCGEALRIFSVHPGEFHRRAEGSVRALS